MCIVDFLMFVEILIRCSHWRFGIPPRWSGDNVSEIRYVDFQILFKYFN